MNKKWILFLLMFLVVYLLVCNMIYIIEYNSTTQQTQNTIIKSSEERLTTEHSVDVETKKSRFIGTVYEFISEDTKQSHFALFGFLPIPLQDDNIHFIRIHAVILTVWLFAFIFSLIIKKEVNKK